MNMLLNLTLPNLNLVADSLGWAVLHSLWQGALAAGIVYIVRNLTRERASEARYFTGIITLCVLLCAFIGTFLYYYNTGAAISGAASTDIIQTITIGFSETASTGNPLMRLGDFTGLIGVFWTVCFAVLGMRYLSAFRLTHKLRKHGLSDLPADWQARFKALADTSGVSPKVRAYFSEYVSSPITFGFLKPIVLLPPWFFTGMTPEQCEAVLLHELAHIRRHDYLTNILQIAIKTVFFYHPAVGFICKGLDTDREHACDDFAVMLTKNPESLATALGTIRLKAASGGGVFALSADGRDAPLMHRLKRLMGTQSKSLQKNTTRGLAATAMMSTALVLVMTLGSTASQAHPKKQDTLAGGLAKVETKPSIVVNGETYMSGTSDKNKMKNIFKIKDRQGHAYYVIDGKKYPSKYTYDLFSKDGKTYIVKQKNGKRYIEIGDSWYRAETVVIPTPPTPATSPGHNYWVSDQVRAATEARAETASNRREAALERAQEMREQEMERTEGLREAAWERAEAARERQMQQVEKLRETALERNEGLRVAAPEQRKQKQFHKMRDKLIPLLKADGFMKTDHSKVTIKMTPTDVFINGGKLAEAQESKYCDIVSKYISRKDDVKKIVIKPGYLHISQKSDGHNSTYTFNEN